MPKPKPIFFFLYTILLTFGAFYCFSQGLSKKKSKPQILYDHTFVINGADTVDCKRMQQFQSRVIIEIDEDHQDLLTKMENVESFLVQIKSGYTTAQTEVNFKQNITALGVLEKRYKIDLGLADYEREFEFYKKYPSKTPEEISKEKLKKYYEMEAIEREAKELMIAKQNAFNMRIQNRNDSVEIIEKKRQASNDSIDEVNYRIEIHKQEAEERIRQKKAAQESLEREALRKQEVIRKRQELIGKYGPHDGELMFNKKVKIGWTKEKCLESWGKPRQINRTTTANFKNEQWVYTIKKYLYFENGVLTAIQD